MSENIAWQPLPKQAEFLSSNADICLYGGSAGSGKTDALLIDALGLNQSVPAITTQSYTALIVRQLFTDLRDIIQRSLILYPQICPQAKYLKNEHVWYFPSGSRIMFGNCENDDDVTKYQGSNFSYIAIEEIGLFETSTVFEFLRSRLRTTDDRIKPYFRATCNPSKFKWLREYFQINDDGDSSTRYEEYTTSNGVNIKLKIQFISAKLSDNKYLFENGEYEAKLMSLNEEDRNAFLGGKWNAYNSVAGQIYENELKAFKARNGLCKIPYDNALDVYAAVDLGMSDSFVIIFFQVFGREIRIIDFHKDNGKSIPHYCKIIKDKMFEIKKLYVPHDSTVRELGSGLTRTEQFEANLSCKVDVLPRLGLEDGISMAKVMFKDIWINDTCIEVLDDLTNYKRRKDPKTNEWKEPIHDSYSHAADAFRYISYAIPDIMKPILDFAPSVRKIGRF